MLPSNDNFNLTDIRAEGNAENRVNEYFVSEYHAGSGEGHVPENPSISPLYGDAMGERVSLEPEYQLSEHTEQLFYQTDIQLSESAAELLGQPPMQMAAGASVSIYAPSTNNQTFYRGDTVRLGANVSGESWARITVRDPYNNVVFTWEQAVGTYIEKYWTIPNNATLGAHALKIAVVNGSNQETASMSGTIYVAAAVAPPAPTGLRVSGKTMTSIDIDWNASSGATSYQIFVNNTYVGNTSATGTTINGMVPGTTYSFYVKAQNQFGTSGSSNTVSGTTSPPPAPSAPTNLRVTGKTSTSVDIEWNASAYATSYLIYINNTYIGETQALGVNVGGMTPGATYSFYVRAKNVSGTSGNSNTVTVTTTMTAPPAPTGLAIVEKTATTMSIVWNYAAGATSYQVFINGSNIGEVTSEGAYISGLALNTTYSFYVRAKNSVGVSGNSNTVQGTTTARYKGVTN